MMEAEHIYQFFIDQLTDTVSEMDSLSKEMLEKRLCRIVDNAKLMHSYLAFRENNRLLEAAGKPPVRAEDVYTEKEQLVIQFFQKHEDLW